MARKKQVRKIRQLRKQLVQQRLATRVSARRPIARLRQFGGWPLAVTGFGSGFLIGRLRVYAMLARALSASMLALRLEQTLNLLVRRL